MTTPQILLLALIGVGFLLIMSHRARPDLVALLVMVALVMAGLVSPEDALDGFSQPSIVALAGLFVITEALDRAGAVHWVGGWISRLAGNSEARLVLVLMLAGALLSLTMNNVVAGALLLPTAVNAGRRAGVPPSRLLIPLAFGILLGGMSTVFTTANIIVNGQLHQYGQPILSMDDFLRVGGVAAVAGVLYMLLLGRHLLPRRSPAGRDSVGVDVQELGETYGLARHLWEARIHDESPFASRTIRESEMGSRHGLSVLAILRGQDARFDPPPDEPVEAGDVLLLLGPEERARAVGRLGVTLGRSRQDLPVELTEAVVAPRSPAVGRTLAELRFRERTGLTVVGLWRGTRSHLSDLSTHKLQPGDALLVVGPPSEVVRLARDGDFLVPDVLPWKPMERGHALWALAVAGATMAVAAWGHLPMAQLMLAGAALLVLLGCLSLDDAYRAVDWSVIVLVAGMAPLGVAMSNTGLSGLVDDWLRGLPLAPEGFLAMVFVSTVLVTQVVGGQVSALIVGPLILPAALALHPEGDFPRQAAVVMALGCSTAFLTPVAHPVNVLMMAPAGYRARDFWRVGLGLAVVVGAAVLFMAPRGLSH